MRSLVLSLFAAVLLTSGVRAEDKEGVLSGSVRTKEGVALPHLILTVTGPSGARTVVTGPEGRYRLTGLAAAEYSVASQAPGFADATGATVRVAAGEEARLDLTLSPAPVRERVLVSATRGDAALSTLGVTATVVDRDQIADRAPSSLASLLQEVPGVTTARSGGLGLQTSAFVRGGESRFARVLIDGVPVNEPGGFYNFASQLPFELEQVEVVRGAASSLYGTDALAGVLNLVTRRSETGRAASVNAEAEGGGFGWRRGQGGTSGQSARFDWNAGLLRLETKNQESNSTFEENAGAVSMGARLTDRASLRIVFRGETSEAGTPGQTAYQRPDLDARYDRTAWTLGGQLRHVHGRAAHELRVGLTRTDQLSVNPKDSGPYTTTYQGRTGYSGTDFTNGEGFQNDTRRLSAGYQVELQASSRHLLTAGLDMERETGALGDLRLFSPLLTPARTNFGAYVQDRVIVGDRVFITAGGRVERNDSFGTRAVPRIAIAWRLRGVSDATMIKASAGAGIKEPGFLESFGVAAYAQGNPDLKPERSRTVDFGVEQRLLRDRVRGTLTLYRHDYLDQIAYTVVSFEPFHGTYTNLGKTRGQGIEAHVEAAPKRDVQISATYTYLDGEVLVSGDAFGSPIYEVGKPLLRRPEHQGSISAQGGTDRLRVGATLLYVGRRADSDFAGLELTENGGYARVDVRARFKLVRGLEAFAVSENLLDRKYQEVLGYPALGRMVRGGLRFRSGS